MGNSSTACTETVFAKDAAETSSASSESPATSDDETSHVAPQAAQPLPRFSARDTATATPAALRSWLPVHEARAERSAVARSEAQAHNEQAADVGRCLASQEAEEQDLRAAQAALYTELEAAEDEKEHEADLRQVLLSELAERDLYSTELHARMLDAEESRRTTTLDSANLRSDIATLRTEMCWAERYRENIAAQRSHLESEVLEADCCLLERQREAQMLGRTTQLAGYDLQREEQSEQAVEAFEASAAGRWTEAVTELQMQRSRLQIQLMHEEHQRQTAANDLDLMRIGPGGRSNIQELTLLM